MSTHRAVSRDDGIRCETCVYWDKIEGENAGSCNRRSPAPMLNGGHAIWPETHADDWCGEHPSFAGVLVL